MQRAGFTSLLLALTLLFGACDEVYPPQTSEPTPAGKPLTTLPWFMEGFSLLDEYTEELAVGELVTETGCEIGSAVLIAPRIVITAGHCVDDGDVKYFKSGCTLYRIFQHRLHPKYKIGDTVFVDLAVCLLETTCPAVPIRFMNAETNKYTRGEPLTVIGFGGDYKRRSNYGVFWYYGTLLETPTEFKMLPIKGTVFFGDSGGAVIDGSGALVGIVSSLGMNGCGVYENSATRLDLFSDWVKTTTLELSGVPLEVAP